MNKNAIIAILIIIILVVIGVSVFAHGNGKENTQISILSPEKLKNGDIFQFELKDSKGSPIANQTVTIGYESDGHQENYTIHTDKDGKGNLIITGEPTGKHNIIVKYNGTEKYSASEAKTTITIEEGTSDAASTTNMSTNSTESTVKYNDVAKSSSSNTGRIFYDAKYNIYYNENGIIIGGQNNGMRAIDVMKEYDQWYRDHPNGTSNEMN